ncbi:MAG: hypothetical protein GXY32_11455 [Ruminococcaceae bacterium]|nr:hypothetical protein [Oscillospiraceae bacterium]
MIVVKKSDAEEKFSFEKLGKSIQAANADTNEPLDIPLLFAEFQNIVADNEYITTGQINVVVYGLLYSKNAMQTLKNYADFKKYE